MRNPYSLLAFPADSKTALHTAPGRGWRRSGRQLLLLGTALLASAVGANAASITWNNGAGDGLYATATNWAGGVAPANNDYQDVAVFNAGPRTITVPASQKVGSLNFLTGGWTLSTGSFAEVTNLSSAGTTTNHIVTPLTLHAAATWTIASGHTLAMQNLYERSYFIDLTGGGLVTMNTQIGGYSGSTGQYGIRLVNGRLKISAASPYTSGATGGSIFFTGVTTALQLSTTVASAQALIGTRVIDQTGRGLIVTDLGGGVVQIAPNSTPVPPIAGNWTLTFDEEFNSANTYLDPTKWKVGGHYAGIAGTGGNDPANISVAGGALQLKTQVRPYSFSGTNYSYAASEITTFKAFRQQYGYFESRLKFPGVTGVWPAFWLMPDRASYGWADNYFRSYIKFDLTAAGITSVTSAQLKMTVSGSTTGGVNNVLVMKERNDTWTEAGITWNNAPLPDPAWIKQYYGQTYTVGQQLSTDVTGWVQEKVAGNKKVCFVLADTFMRAQQVKFYSRETATQAQRPQLVINGVTYYPTEDAYVQAGSQATVTHPSTMELQVREDWGDTATTFNGGMETDIQESLGKYGPDHTYITTHWDGYGTSHQSASIGKVTYPATGDGFHTYGLYWQAGLMEFYVDGVQKWSWANTRVCSVPCYILLSMQLGGWDANNAGAQVDNQVTQVDYVRVWSGTKN